MVEKYRRRYRVFPELARFENDEERTRVLKNYSRKVFRSGYTWVILFIGIPILTTLLVLVTRIALPGWSGYVSGVIAGVSFGAGFQWLLRSPLRRNLRRELIDRGVPICLHCGYDLRGQNVPRCPECGVGFDEHLLRGSEQ